jgi:hypothetical protein
MPSKSAAQHRLMEAVAHDPGFAKRVGISQSVGRDFAAADRARGYAGGGLVESALEALAKMRRAEPLAAEAGATALKLPPKESAGALTQLLRSLPERAGKLAAEGVRRGVEEGRGPLAALRTTVAPHYAVRPKGGNFNDLNLGTYLGNEDMRVPETKYDPPWGTHTNITLGEGGTRSKSTSAWAETQLANYLRKEIGSPSDPLLQVEKEYPGLHLPPDALEPGSTSHRDAEHVNRTIDALKSSNYMPVNGRYDAHAKSHMGLTGEPLTPWGRYSDISLKSEYPDQHLMNDVSQAMDTGTYPEDMGWQAERHLKLNSTPAAQLQELLKNPENAFLKKYEWLINADPKTKIWGLRNESTDSLGFSHVLDYLEAAQLAHGMGKQVAPEALQLLRNDPNALRDVGPQVGNALRLHDAGLSIDPDSLKRLSVADAVRRTAQWNEILANQGIQGNADLARGIARVHKEYPEGMRWVELGKPETKELPEGYKVVEYTPGRFAVQSPVNGYITAADTAEEALKRGLEHIAEQDLEVGLNAEGSAMGHCVGGYCDDVASRGTKIYSLRDKNNNPHVTVEVRGGRPETQPEMEELDDFIGLNSPYEREAQARLGDDAKPIDWLRDVAANHPFPITRRDAADRLKQYEAQPANIIQIKGKSNAAPVEKYLPYVQDFVKSGQWGRVGDLQNSGLNHVADSATLGPLTIKPGYYTDAELADLARQSNTNATPEGIQNWVDMVKRRGRVGFAEGGSVPSLEELRARGEETARNRQSPGLLNTLKFLADSVTNVGRGVVGATGGMPGELERLGVAAGHYAAAPKHPEGRIAGALEALHKAGQDKMLFPSISEVTHALPQGTRLLGAPEPEYNALTSLGEFAPLPPAAAYRAVKPVVGAAGKLAAEGIRRGVEEGRGPLGLLQKTLSPNYAIRPRGGNYHDKSLDTYLGHIMPEGAGPDDPTNKWLLTQLRNYIRKDLGSPTDPLLQVEKEYPNLHLPEGQLAVDFDIEHINQVLAGRARPRSPTLKRIANEHKALTTEPMTPWGMHSTAESAIYRSPYSYAENSTGALSDYAEYLPGSPLRKQVEAQKDPAATEAFIQEALSNAKENGDNLPEWLLRAPEETKFYGINDPYEDTLGFGHVKDYLQAAQAPYRQLRRLDLHNETDQELVDMVRQEGRQAMLPFPPRDMEQWQQLMHSGLDLEPEQLNRLSVADAVRRTAQWNELLANQGQANEDLARGITRVHKEYPEGMRWVELGQPTLTELPDRMEVQPVQQGGYTVGKKGEKPPIAASITHQTPEEAVQNWLSRYGKNFAREELNAGLNAEGQAMGHCAGTYCDDVASRGTKIYSLRDKNNNPHVTMEVRPGQVKVRNADLWKYASPEERSQLLNQYPGVDWENSEGTIGQATRWVQNNMPELYKQTVTSLGEPVHDIIQIKGKSNAAPVEKYLPYVQDFVKSGQWGRVGELSNAGLVDIGNWKSSLLGTDRGIADRAAVERSWAHLFEPLGRYPQANQLDEIAKQLGMPNNRYRFDELADYLSKFQIPDSYATGGSVQPVVRSWPFPLGS